MNTNKNIFTITDIFFLSNNISVLSVEEFGDTNKSDVYDCSIHLNGKLICKIKASNKIIMKGQRKHLNETAFETKDDLSNLKGIDLKKNSVTLKIE